MPTARQTTDWYNDNAEEYLAHVTVENAPYHAYYEKPAIRTELPSLEAKTVLSLGCGTGEDCQYMKDNGAKRVIGVDTAKNLLALARNNYPGCEFYDMSMEKLEFEDETFDLVYSGLAIHYLIGGFEKAFAEAYRMLKPGGFFVLSDGHPINSAMKYVRNDSVLKDKRLGVMTKKANLKETVYGDYLTSRTMEAELFKSSTKTKKPLLFWHQPLSATINQIIGAGFRLEKIIEPLPTEGFKKISKRHFVRLSKIPEMVIFKARKE